MLTKITLQSWNTRKFKTENELTNKIHMSYHGLGFFIVYRPIVYFPNISSISCEYWSISSIPLKIFIMCFKNQLSPTIINEDVKLFHAYCTYSKCIIIPISVRREAIRCINIELFQNSNRFANAIHTPI